MDKASDFGSEDCRFESCHGRPHSFGEEGKRKTLFCSRAAFSFLSSRFFKITGSGGIRTHASEETGALNQRLRPLGHATLVCGAAYDSITNRSGQDIES